MKDKKILTCFDNKYALLNSKFIFDTKSPKSGPTESGKNDIKPTPVANEGEDNGELIKGYKEKGAKLMPGQRTELAIGKPAEDARINRASQGQPEVKKEDYPDALKALKTKMKKLLKGKEPHHAQAVGHFHKDNHNYFLVYDSNKKEYRLFRSKDADALSKPNEAPMGDAKFKEKYKDKLDKSKYTEVYKKGQYKEDIQWGETELKNEGHPKNKYEISEKKVTWKDGNKTETLMVYIYKNKGANKTRAFIKKSA